MLDTIFFVYENFFECYAKGVAHYKASPYRGFRILGSQSQIIYARSLWEANYARYLQFLQDQKQICYWHHEPRIFYFDGIKRGINNYTPDFFVATGANGDGYWVEVKGYMDAASKTKIARFKKYYPEEKLVVVDSKWFKSNAPKLKLLIPDWETPTSIKIVPTDKIKNLRRDL